MGGMDLYELSLVVNRLQEKAIRELFKQRNWQFIIAGVKKCEIARLPCPIQLQEQPEDCVFPEEEPWDSTDNGDVAVKSRQRSVSADEILNNTEDDETDDDDDGYDDLSDSSGSSYHTPAVTSGDKEETDSHVKTKREGSKSRQSSPILQRDPEEGKHSQSMLTVHSVRTSEVLQEPSSLVDLGVTYSGKHNTGRPTSMSARARQDPGLVNSAKNCEPHSIKQETASSELKEFECGNCAESFYTFMELRVHLQHHKQAIEGVAKLRNVDRQCLLCDIKFPNAYLLRIHKRIHRTQPSREPRPAANQTHQRKPGQSKLKTSSTTVGSSSKLTKENFTVTGDPLLEASERTKLGSYPVKPLASPSKSSPRKRGRPRKQRPSLPNLTSESVRKLPEVYDCGNCSESFPTFSALRQHLQLHKEAIEGVPAFFNRRRKPTVNKKITYQSRHCETCGKTFPNAAALRVHDRVHSGERPYLCNQCGKAFKQQTAFQNHLRTHTGETPFKCTVCDTSFRQLGELHRHQRRHTGEKPQLCMICGKRFAEQSYLKSHMRLHTGEKPFSCNLCEKSFSQRTSLKVHMKSHHKDVCELGGNPPVMASLDSTEDVRQTLLETETDSRETQPMPSEFIPMDFRINNQQAHMNNPHTQDHADHQPLLHPQFLSADPSANILPAHVNNYHNTATPIQPPHPQFVPVDPTANIQSWISYHTDMNIAGVY